MGCWWRWVSKSGAWYLPCTWLTSWWRIQRRSTALGMRSSAGWAFWRVSLGFRPDGKRTVLLSWTFCPFPQNDYVASVVLCLALRRENWLCALESCVMSLRVKIFVLEESKPLCDLLSHGLVQALCYGRIWKGRWGGQAGKNCWWYQQQTPCNRYFVPVAILGPWHAFCHLILKMTP